jgi:hypothetical protein
MDAGDDFGELAPLNDEDAEAFRQMDDAAASSQMDTDDDFGDMEEFLPDGARDDDWEDLVALYPGPGPDPEPLPSADQFFHARLAEPAAGFQELLYRVRAALQAGPSSIVGAEAQAAHVRLALGNGKHGQPALADQLLERTGYSVDGHAWATAPDRRAEDEAERQDGWGIPQNGDPGEFTDDYTPSAAALPLARRHRDRTAAAFALERERSLALRATAVDPADALYLAFLRSCPFVEDEAGIGPAHSDNDFPDTGGTTQHDRQTQACDALDAFLQRVGAQCIDSPPTDAGGQVTGLYKYSRYYSHAQATAAAGSPERAMMNRLAGAFALLQTCAAVRLHRTCVEVWCRHIAESGDVALPAGGASFMANLSSEDEPQRSVRAIELRAFLPGAPAMTAAAGAVVMLRMWYCCEVQASFGTAQGGRNTGSTTVRFGGIRVDQPVAASASDFDAPAALLLAATMYGDRTGDHMLWHRRADDGAVSQEAARDFQNALLRPRFIGVRRHM